MVIKTFYNPVLKSAKISPMPKKIAGKIFTKNKNNFFGTCLFSTFKAKNVFQKFRFFSQILSPIRLGAILCAHAILCAPTVETAVHPQMNIEAGTICRM